MPGPRMHGRGSLSPGKETGTSGCCCLECYLPTWGCSGNEEGEETPCLPEQGSQGNALTLSSQIPWRRPCQHSATVPWLAVQSAPSHSVPQPTSDRGTGRNTETPAKLSRQDGKGGLVQARGSQLERAALARRQAVVSHSCAKKELGASTPRSHVEARMLSHRGRGG